MECELRCIQDQTPLRVVDNFPYKGSLVSIGMPQNAVWLTPESTIILRDTLNEILEAYEERKKSLAPLKFYDSGKGSGIEVSLLPHGVEIRTWYAQNKSGHLVSFDDVNTLIDKLVLFRDSQL